MKKKEAIRLIQQQVDRLSKQNPTDDWVIETATYLKAIFGEGSEQHRKALSWHGPRLFPSTVTKEELRRHGLDERRSINLFLTSCISAVKAGIMHKPERKNFLSDASNVPLLSFGLPLLIAVLSVGYWAGHSLAPTSLDSPPDHEAKAERQPASDANQQEEAQHPSPSDSNAVLHPQEGK